MMETIRAKICKKPIRLGGSGSMGFIINKTVIKLDPTKNYVVEITEEAFYNG